MQNNKEKIVNILTSELSYCYCDNCKYGDWDKYQDDYCFDCHRKYQNWELSPDTAAEIAEQILKEVIYNAKEEGKI